MSAEIGHLQARTAVLFGHGTYIDRDRKTQQRPQKRGITRGLEQKTRFADNKLSVDTKKIIKTINFIKIEVSFSKKEEYNNKREQGQEDAQKGGVKERNDLTN